MKIISSSYGTKLEIFTNPYDLEITVAQSGTGGRFSLCLSRGPWHRFKVMLTCVDFACSLDEGARSVGELLKVIHESVTKVNPPGMYDNSDALTQSVIEQVVTDILNTGTASTYKYKVAKR